MLRTLFAASEARPALRRPVAKAAVAHLAQEHRLLFTDPVVAWSQTRWPDFVELCQYVVDRLVPAFGDDPDVMPLGAGATAAMLLNASAEFRRRGMDWRSYYHRSGPVKFPLQPVNTWNTNDHGVNNAEGAVRYPAVTYRLTGDAADAAELAYVEIVLVVRVILIL